jgi:hypothetical protein
MWLEKLTQGMLRVLTPLGPRYVNPALWQRVYLVWLFRNFHTLPVKVLSRRQQKRLERMCTQHGFVALATTDVPILGTLEQRPPIEPESGSPRGPGRGVAESVSPFAADLNHHS